MLKKEVALKELREINLEGCCEELKDLVRRNIKIIEVDIAEFYRDEIVKSSGKLLQLLEIPQELKNDAVINHITLLTDSLKDYHSILESIKGGEEVA